MKKQRVNEILQELSNRKKNDRISKYNKGKKVHKKQLAFHKCEKRNRWVFGGNRSGKTECGAVECVWLARGIHPFKENKPTSGWVVSLSSQVQRDVAQSKVLSYLKPHWIEKIVMQSGKQDFPESGIIDHIIVKNVFGTTSRIGFRNCEQGREKFQGTSLDYVWFDEEPPQDIYVECRMRVLDRCGEIFGTMTPLKGLTWVFGTIYLNENNDAEVWHTMMSWEDNPYLNKAEVSLMENAISKDELESRRDGKFLACGGMVFNEFSEEINVIEPFNIPLEWQDTISIDPGLNNPLSAHWYAVDFDGNVFVVAEHYMAGKPVDWHAERIKEICKRLNWHTSYGGKIEALIDSAGKQRTLASEKSVCDLFFENGIATNPKVNKDLFSGINRVKSFFKNSQNISKLFIFKTCTNMIREIKTYWWGNADVPIKKDDHSLDELRYYIMSRPDPAKVVLPKSELEQHKEKIARKNVNFKKHPY